MSCALLGMGSVANAGQWKVTGMHASGKTIFPPQSEFYPNDDGYGRAEEFPGGRDWIGYADGSSGSVSTYSGYQVTSSKPGAVLERKDFGSAVATFKWDATKYGYPDNSPVPEWLFVEVTAIAYAKAESFVGSLGGKTNAANSVNVLASNGYESVPSLSDFLSNNGQSPSVLSNNGQSRTAIAHPQTVKVLQVPSHGRSIITVELPSLSMTATGRNPSDAWPWEIFVSVGATPRFR